MVAGVLPAASVFGVIDSSTGGPPGGGADATRRHKITALFPWRGNALSGSHPDGMVCGLSYGIGSSMGWPMIS
jgi:hypothetical protein